MDSLTQAVLGATVGHALLGKKIGRAAPIIGALLGTLPDLDVLVPFGGEVENFTYHRSFSHSLLVQLAVTPFLAWLFTQRQAYENVSFKSWCIAILAIFWTHSLLDAHTVYGTQLFWPLSDYPVGFSSVFIIDPLYTLPLLVSLCLAYNKDWRSHTSHKISCTGLVLSSLYLIWGLTAKSIIDAKISEAWKLTGKEAETLVSTLSTPMPLNSLLWRVIINEEDAYHIAHIAVWEDPSSVTFRSFEKGSSLLKTVESHWDVERLIWFTKGFYKAERREDQIVMSDLRMGVEGSYAFNFAIAQQADETTTLPIKALRIEDPIAVSKLPLIWKRLWDPHFTFSNE